MDIFKKLRLLCEAIEEAHSIEDGKSIVEELMQTLEIDRGSITWHLGRMSGDTISKIREMQNSKIEEMEQEESYDELVKLRKYYDGKLDELYKLQHAIIDFMTAVCNTRELD